MSLDATPKRFWTLRWSRWWVSMACVVLILVAIVVYAKMDAVRGLNNLVREELISSAMNASELLVIVHGYAGNIRSMDDVRAAAHEERRDADLLLLEFPAQAFSNADCFRVSDSICNIIK